MRFELVGMGTTLTLGLLLTARAFAQEPADQDKTGRGVAGHKKPLPGYTGAAPGQTNEGGKDHHGGEKDGPATGAAEKVAYDFELPGADGRGMPLASFKGKTILVVNLASKSDFNAQLPALEKLAETYKDKGLVVIGVPSNEFGAAEPGTDAELQKLYTGANKVTFPVMSKSTLTGDQQLPLYGFLTKANGGPVHWNYTKFFIDKTGKVVARFEPAVTPDSVEMQAAVVEILEGRYKTPGTGDAMPSGRRGGSGMGAAN